MKRTVHVDGQAYEFNQDEMTNEDAIVLEDYSGWGVEEWGERLARSSGRALTFLVWFCRRANEPDLRVEDVHFKLATLDLREQAEAGDVVEGAVVPKGKGRSAKTSGST